MSLVCRDMIPGAGRASAGGGVVFRIEYAGKGAKIPYIQV
jgi:hypothetical protein